MSKSDLIKAVREHALRNYERNGWDYVVECWSDKDIEEAIGRCTGVRGAIDKVKAAVAPLASYRSEVRAEIF